MNTTCPECESDFNTDNADFEDVNSVDDCSDGECPFCRLHYRWEWEETGCDAWQVLAWG